MQKIGTVLLALMVVSSAAPALAQTVDPQALVNQIQQLQQQINQLKQQQQQNLTTLVSTLEQGSSGDQVKVLQALLSADPAIYPEGKISGFFGALTARAVKRFQKKYSLSQVGKVGPKTLQKLNDFLANNPAFFSFPTSTATSTPNGVPFQLCIPPGHLIAPGWLKHMIQGKDKEEKDNGKDNNENEKNNDHFFSGFCPPTPSTSTDVTAPIISSVFASGVTSTSATVNWSTNEPANSQVLYGPTTTLGFSTTLDAGLVTTHAQSLTGLSASTTYFYVVQSQDAANNLASSTQQSFTTPSATSTDTSAPVISALSAGAGTSTATVSWTTNEVATDQVMYGTSTALGLTSTLNSALGMSHTQILTGLLPGTTYFYQAQSKDAANNTGTSGIQSFVTASTDVTAPVISSVFASSVTSTSATVNWSTNEMASSQVFYGPSIAMGSSTTLDAGLVLIHAQALTGLSASTTYFYVVQSRDGSGNLASSSQQSFTTLGQ